MGYQSVNEVENFSFEDCQISSVQIGEEYLEFEVEALIIKPNNSQNKNYTESYAGTTKIRFQGGRLLSGIKDGYKYYDANEVLQSETPDEELTMEQLLAMLKRSSGAYLYGIQLRRQEDGTFYYTMGVEFVSEEAYDTTPSDSYQLEVVCEQFTVSWESYMNRVQR
jgi:hypothetical protein